MKGASPVVHDIRNHAWAFTARRGCITEKDLDSGITRVRNLSDWPKETDYPRKSVACIGGHTYGFDELRPFGS